MLLILYVLRSFSSALTILGGSQTNISLYNKKKYSARSQSVFCTHCSISQYIKLHFVLLIAVILSHLKFNLVCRIVVVGLNSTTKVSILFYVLLRFLPEYNCELLQILLILLQGKAQIFITKMNGNISKAKENM